EKGPRRAPSSSLFGYRLETLATSATAEDERCESDEQRHDATHLLPLHMSSLWPFLMGWPDSASGSVNCDGTYWLVLNVELYDKNTSSAVTPTPNGPKSSVPLFVRGTKRLAPDLQALVACDIEHENGGPAEGHLDRIGHVELAGLH